MSAGVQFSRSVVSDSLQPHGLQHARLCPENAYVELLTPNVMVPVGSAAENLPPNIGNAGLIPRLGRFPGKWHGNPLQYSCLENPMDRGAGWVIVHGLERSRTWHSNMENVMVTESGGLGRWLDGGG